MSAPRMLIGTGRAVLACALLWAPAALAENTVAEAGRALVVENCARCHAVEPTGQSPLKAAPALRTLHDSYPVDTLAEAFAEGIVTGHADMPQFVLSPEEIAEVIAYLESLQD